MKTKRVLIFIVILILTACAPAPAATEESATQPPDATEPPVTQVEASPTAIEATATPSLQVGDDYLYIDGTKLVAVPSGEFTMGGNGSDNPAHLVTLRDYWIYFTKVTNQQYAVCVQLGTCSPPDQTDNPGYSDIQHANDPATGITYEQAAAYCSFINGRLPTEAEWEKAAGDPQGGNYPWGDEPPTCELANSGDCAEGLTNVIDHSNGASYYGALDMLGNAFEWVSDWYDGDFYQNSPTENPTGPEGGSAHVIRSSGPDSDPEEISITNRDSEDPLTHRPDLGFRCVVDQPEQFAPLCELPLVYGNQTATSTCPTLDLVQEELCAKNFPYTIVSVKGATDATLESEGCTATGDPAIVSCQPPSTISATAGCQVELSGDSTCPVGYSLQENTCIADGAQGACPAGLNFDSTNQCCGMPETPTKLPICPVGTFHLASQNACLPDPVQELVTVSVEVEFKACTARPGGGGGDGGDGTSAPACQDPGCGPYENWDPVQCKCVSIF